MFIQHASEDSKSYRMDYRRPHETLEDVEREIAIVDDALRALRDAGIIEGIDYDRARFDAHRAAIREHFEIPWTAITPRMQRLLYAITAIRRPRTILSAGVFCGVTYVACAGAAVGPGKCFDAQDVVGLEIDAERAALAERNMCTIDPTGKARVLAEDAVAFARDYDGPIDLLYLDADGAGGRGKAIYLDILRAGLDRIEPGGIVLAHNSVNCARQLVDYFAFVRDDANMTVSTNVVIDPEGLEVTVK